MSAEFDHHVSTYDEKLQRALVIPGTDAGWFARLKAGHMIRTAAQCWGTLTGLRMLDVGCGTGVILAAMQSLGVHFAGTDPSEKMLEVARANAPHADLRVMLPNGKIPFAPESFDLAYAVCVLHHVPLGERLAFVNGMTRMVRPGGRVAVYEHNPFNPLTRLTVSRCEFDQGVVLSSLRETCALFRAAGLVVEHAPYIGFIPWETRVSPQADSFLAWLPLGAQYAVWGRVPEY